MMHVGALLRLDRTRPPPLLDALPMGRAARLLLDEGIVVVLADRASHNRVSGYVATADGWKEAHDVAIVGAYDRYPRPKYPQDHARLLDALSGIVVGNPPSIRELSRDKLISQRLMQDHGVPMPPVEADPDAFDDALNRWGAAFAKPRFGAGGAGVERVVAGDDVAPVRPGALGELEPTLLQRAVPPPAGWYGIATRTIVQRDADQSWVCAPTVARRSPSDWVVNVARGAEPVAAVDVLGSDTVDAIVNASTLTARALASEPEGDRLLEIGVDAMVDADGVPWVIEVNTRPWGRLSALYARDPDRWEHAHVQTVARPFRALAGRAAQAR